MFSLRLRLPLVPSPPSSFPPSLPPLLRVLGNGFEGKCNYKDVLAKLKSNLSADTSQVLDGLLVELKVN